MNETIKKSIEEKAKELHGLIERARSEGLDVKFKHITGHVSSDDKIKITVSTQRVLCKSSI